MKFIDYPQLHNLSRTLTYDSSECTVHTRIEAYSCKSTNKEKRLFRGLEHSYHEELHHHPFATTTTAPEDLEDTQAFGPLDKRARKTLYLLIATLNAAFPDHDFRAARPDHFSKEPSGAAVLNALSNSLLGTRPNFPGPRTYSAYPPASSDLFPSSSSSVSSSPVSYFARSNSPSSGSKNASSITGGGGGGAQGKAVSGTHPTLYRVLDEIITLADCTVYAYHPDVESDPHGGGASGDTDSDFSDSESESSPAEEEGFDFDDDPPLAVSASPPKASRWSRWDNALSSSPGASSPWDDTRSSPSHSPERGVRRKGALLWSSYWFFYNKKEKRMLFTAVWARKKTFAWVPGEDTFVGWAGAHGAGARALGLLDNAYPKQREVALSF